MKSKKITNIVFILYLVLLCWLVLLKLATNINQIPHMRNINLIPFADSVIVNGKIYLKEIIYNILAFVPLGVYLSIKKSNWGIWHKVLIGFGLSLTFETVQYILAIGGSDITDLLGNTFGTFLGVYLFIILKKIFKDKTVSITNTIGLIIETGAILLIILLTIAN